MNVKFFLGLALTALFFTSCTKNDAEITTSTSMEVDQPSELVTEPITEETIEFLNQTSVSLDDAELTTMQYPDGTTEEVYIIEGDITLTGEELRTIQETIGNAERQAHTYQLCNNYQTIDIIGYTGNNSSGLTYNMQVGLSWAVANYNSLNIGLNFNLTFGTNYSSKDIVVYRVANGQSGGVAGFPYSNGQPYKWVRIYSGLDNAAYNTCEHVIGHEIGHCLGMRHTDWSTRASCGQSGEAANPTGAVHIPGTPLSWDANSLMLACFGCCEDGEFGYYDRVALEYMY